MGRAPPYWGAGRGPRPLRPQQTRGGRGTQPPSPAAIPRSQLSTGGRHGPRGSQGLTFTEGRSRASGLLQSSPWSAETQMELKFNSFPVKRETTPQTSEKLGTRSRAPSSVAGSRHHFGSDSQTTLRKTLGRQSARPRAEMDVGCRGGAVLWFGGTVGEFRAVLSCSVKIRIGTTDLAPRSEHEGSGPHPASHRGGRSPPRLLCRLPT